MFELSTTINMPFFVCLFFVLKKVINLHKAKNSETNGKFVWKSETSNHVNALLRQKVNKEQQQQQKRKGNVSHSAN